MRTVVFACLLVLGAIGCGPPSPSEAFAASVDRVTALTVSSQALGVAPSTCATRSRRYDFTRNTLTLTECAASRTVTARPADGAALRDALRAVTIVSAPCNGYDGVNTSVSFEFEAGVTPTGYVLGAASCPGGGVGTGAVDTIDPATRSPAQAILDRLAAGP